MDHFQPDKAEDDAQAAHEPEHVRPAHGRDQPAHNRCEDHGGKVLGRVEDRHRRAAFLRREPGCDYAAVARERRCFSQADQETQNKQRHDDAKAAEQIDEPLQKGKQRPGEDAPEVDAF